MKPREIIYLVLLALLAAVLALPLIRHFSEQPQVVTRTEPAVAVATWKPELNAVAPVMKGAQLPEGADSIMAAVYARPEGTWFLKICAQTQDLVGESQNFIALLSSLQFDGKGEATWELPGNWRQLAPVNQMIYASFASGQSRHPHSITLSMLPPGADLQENILRWRKQLNQDLSQPLPADAVKEFPGAQFTVVRILPQERAPAAASTAPVLVMPPNAAEAMLVAVYARADATWFLKFTAPAATLREQELLFATFARSMSFKEQGGVEWQLPVAWSQVANPSSMRHATFAITDLQAKHDISLSRLSADQDLGANVNRWRGQLSEEVRAALPAEVVQDCGAFKLVRLLPATDTPAAPAVPAKTQNPAFPAQAPITIEAPPGWTAQKAQAPRLAWFRQDGGEAQIMVTAVTNVTEEASLQLWASQLGLDAAAAAPRIETLTPQLKVYTLDNGKEALCCAVHTSPAGLLYIKYLGTKEGLTAGRRAVEAIAASLKENP